MCVRVTLNVDETAHVLGDLFFFQAEDGIRDLVRSRGLGDVYKRQRYASAMVTTASYLLICYWQSLTPALLLNKHYFVSVSYTHLTLPTSDLV